MHSLGYLVMTSLHSTTHEELRQVLDQLDQALYNHQQWHNILIRTLVCRLTADKNDLSPNSYKQCRFGQWYYGPGNKIIEDHPGFFAMGESHMRMHQLAMRLLTSASTSNISPLDFDHFANAVEQTRLETLSLKSELENLLYNRDPLTNAINRINMLPILREQQALIQRQGLPCSIAMLDLDHFKNINDRYGHSIGDAVLTAVARFLIENIRPYDKIFRFGGEEFLLCLPFTELKIAHNLMERLRTGLSTLPIDINQKKPLTITISIGLSSLDSKVLVEDSIDCADTAMYEAKSAGRNCTRIWKVKSEQQIDV